MKYFYRILFTVMALFVAGTTAANKNNEKLVVAYVTSWTNVMPDPFAMTHINYAFGSVNETFDGVTVSNLDRLCTIVALKKQNVKLKVLLSIGGWGSGRFSEMAATEKYRTAFVASCLHVVDKYKLDGIDIDWEYPTQGGAGISCSPDDTHNFSLLMHDLRKALGKRRLLTCATVASGEYIDFKTCIRYLDYVNVMAYDMANPPKHHSALYPSDISGDMTSSQSVDAHLANGVPADKIVLGMPFYGRGENKYHGYFKNNNINAKIKEHWSEQSQVPYLTDEKGVMVYGYENTRSLAAKCQYVIDHHLRGAMYWEYADDNAQGDERKTLALSLLKNHRGTVPPRCILVIAEMGTPHQGFCDAAKKLLDGRTDSLNAQITYVSDLRNIKAGWLEQFHLIIQLNYPPYAWSSEAMSDMQRYIDEGQGSYIGFHHATLLGDIFGAGKMWQWFSDFMGGIRWKNYIVPLADGTICIEDKAHPIMQGVPDTLRLPKDEWYTYDCDPRPKVHVLAHVDESSYTPSSNIRMGDHPVIWINENKAARNVYFQMGHHRELFENPYFVRMFDNALKWTLK